MTNRPEYDSIAAAYSASTKSRDDRAEVLVPTARYYLGDLGGKRVLDLGCGDGFFTRLLRDWGAAEIVGVDLSEKMIEIAQSKEKVARQGITYRVADAVALPVLGVFDVVFAAFLLHYVPSVAVLAEMTRRIASQLPPAGRFISFNENPMRPLHQGIQYDVETVSVGPLRDGSVVKRVHYKNGRKDFEFSHFHFEPDTYARALESAGFANVEWKPFLRDESSSPSAASGYWDEYMGNFSIRVLTCTKI